MSNPLSAEGQIVEAIRRIIRAVELRSRRLLEEFGLTGPQLAALEAVARMERASIGAVARAIHLSQPTVTGIVDRLERRGLIERMRDARDRRAVNLTVTDAGAKVLQQAPSSLRAPFRSELAKLADWEQTQILATLQRVAAMMNGPESGPSDASLAESAVLPATSLLTTEMPMPIEMDIDLPADADVAAPDGNEPTQSDYSNPERTV